MCEHLAALDAELAARGVAEVFRGQAWSETCREWAYFECVLDLAALRARLALDPCVVDHVNDDARSGRERGFVCTVHLDGIMGRPETVGPFAAGRPAAPVRTP